MGNVLNKLRNFKRVLLFDGSKFIRFRVNPSERRLYWIREFSLDKRNWVIQDKYLRLKDVLSLVTK